MTVQQFIDKLATVEDKSLPIVLIDTRSGVVDDPSFRGGKPSVWQESDNGYGVEHEVGQLYHAIYLG